MNRRNVVRRIAYRIVPIAVSGIALGGALIIFRSALPSQAQSPAKTSALTSATPSASDAKALVRALQGDYTLVYDVRPVALAYNETGKPKLPTDPVYDDKGGYTFTASASGDKLLFASQRKHGGENVQLIFDGKRWYSYWSRDNRMKIMPDGLMGEGFFIGRMPLLWPGVGWPRVPFVQATHDVTPDGVKAEVSDPHQASGMKPGLVVANGYVATRTENGALVPTSVVVPYPGSQSAGIPHESWAFGGYTDFHGTPIASLVTWKTHKDLLKNPTNRLDVPYYTYEAKLVSAKAAPVDASQFVPLRLVNGIETGAKATPIDWIRNRQTVTFYYDAKKGSLDANLDGNLPSGSHEGTVPWIRPLLAALAIVLLLGGSGWFAYRALMRPKFA